MNAGTWSKKEKVVARRVFENAYDKECRQLAHRVRKMAIKVNDPSHIWRLHDLLEEKRTEIDEKYDYRYSVLIHVFGRLMREGWVKVEDLEGLKEDKIAKIIQLAEM